jgi:hypothetical protein
LSILAAAASLSRLNLSSRCTILPGSFFDAVPAVDACTMSDDGNTLMGWGSPPNGGFDGWVATLPEPCLFDLNGDCTLDLFDFLAFINLLNTGDPAADCDASGTLDLFDFLCYTDGFNTGC